MPRSESLLPGGPRLADYATLGILASHVSKESVRSAMERAGVKDVRRRLLPMEFTALFVVAMSLYRDVAYEEILRCLLEGMRWLGPVAPEIATKGAVTQARYRLGSESMRLLFEELAKPMAKQETQGAWYRSWLTVVVDGTTLEVPDSEENADAFGYPTNPKPGVFPLLRCACLCETGTHAAFAARVRPYASSEIEMMSSMTEALRPGMLLLADRGFFGYDLWKKAAGSGAELLWRVNSNWTFPQNEILEDGSWIAELRPPSKKHPGQESIRVRVIQYGLKDSKEIYRLVTTILDPKEAPAPELAALYAERWEVEGIFDEMKTHLKGRGLTLRSKTPELALQEFWGMMIAHRALRSLIHEAALKAKVDPDKISFTNAVRIVKRTLPSRATLSP